MTNKNITPNDDEYSISLMAISSAMDTYQERRGEFWSYASVVLRNRLYDYYRSQKKYQKELPASNQAFDEVLDDTDSEFLLQREITQKHYISSENNLKEEIEALNEELSQYGISFFDLAKSSPKAQKTKKKCIEIIKALFLPPPLVDFLEEKKEFPTREINKRVNGARKCIERYKKYMISVVCIIRGDYPGIAEYISSITEELRKEGI